MADVDNKEKCPACQSELNGGATRCAQCGKHLGVTGALLNVATIAGAVVSIVSLVTIAFATYTNFLKPKSANLELAISEATFTDVTNLTCEPFPGETDKPDKPHTNGDTPGNFVLLEGLISNRGNAPGELRIASGSLHAVDASDIQAALAGIGAPTDDSRHVVLPAETRSFASKFPVGRINSDGFYVHEIDHHPPGPGEPSNARFEYDEFLMQLNLYAYSGGKRQDRKTKQVVQFFLEPPLGWKVDNKPYDYSCDSIQ